MLYRRSEDRAGQKAIADGIAALLKQKSLKPPSGRPPSGRYGSSSRMSPLSGVGIPGLDNIKKYSTPGGIESLYRKS